MQYIKSSEKATLQHSLTPGQNLEKLRLFQMEKPQSQTIFSWISAWRPDHKTASKVAVLQEKSVQ